MKTHHLKRWSSFASDIFLIYPSPKLVESEKSDFLIHFVSLERRLRSLFLLFFEEKVVFLLGGVSRALVLGSFGANRRLVNGSSIH